MIGLLVLLLISWGLLFLFEKKNLNAIGIVPKPQRLLQFFIGFVLIVGICLIFIYIETWVKTIQWEFQDTSVKVFYKAFVYHLRSALTEDLVFRGAILYILIRRLGAKRGLLISALCFGVYHVFSYGILEERWILIFYVILITGFTGYVWAYAFYKTKSIYIGLGLHVGYNMLMTCFYESQPYGELLFNEVSRIELSEAADSFYAFFRGLFPPIMTFISFKLLFRLPWMGVKNNSEEIQ